MYAAGKAVFCEKPISQEERGIKACYEQAEQVNKPLFCSFNRFTAHVAYLFLLVLIFCR